MLEPAEMATEGSHEAPQPGPPRQDLSPEARRKRADGHWRNHLSREYLWQVLKRVVVGCYRDGLIHAGNLAYMSMLAIFPFFITGAAVFSLVGEESDRAAAVSAVLSALPPTVSSVIEPVARNVVEARSGWFLWLGGLVGLWSVGSLVETIRDILRRAYGTRATHAFWQYRLLSTGIIIVAILVLLLSFFVQVAIGTAQQIISAYFPELTHALGELAWSRIITGAGVFGSIYLLFFTLAPSEYRRRIYPKWPGAALVTLWWLSVITVLPIVLRSIAAADLTYGSLAGIIITLFFFWLVGLGIVAGAELNAALAEPPMEEGGEEVETGNGRESLEESS